ncbi:MAG: hypothetical protein ABSB80_11050 [Methanoregula sp.]|jgi:hypothetical protein|uniref:hypothetical protein n=1 Tax=Methanoregula sp. TaxID=2052170 RepID=UPI003D09B076
MDSKTKKYLQIVLLMVILEIGSIELVISQGPTELYSTPILSTLVLILLLIFLTYQQPLSQMEK